MPKLEEKQAVVAQIKQNLLDAVSVILVNARGITVENDTRLRKNLRQANVIYKVYKNSMLKFAIQDTPFADLKDYLDGPTSVAISHSDPTCAARIINNEMKQVENLAFKAGVIDGKLYDEAGVGAIANILPRDELLAKLLGSLKSPLASFARVINAVAEKSA